MYAYKGCGDDSKVMQPPLRPHGWAELGLAPRTMPWCWTGGVTPERTRWRVEQFERDRGNTHFQAWNLDRLPVAVGYELGGLHIALRERYPKVRPDWVDLASERMKVLYGHLSELNQPLAITVGYDGFDDLRAYAVAGYGLVEIQDAVGSVTDAAERRWLKSYMRLAVEHGVADVTATGTIELSPVFRSLTSYGRFQAWRTSRQSKRGSFTVENVLTPAAYAYVHEFGHLIETAVWEQGPDAVDHVYGALTYALTGWRGPVTRWSKHLLNYPTTTGEPGPHAGGKRRAAKVKAALAPAVRSQLGRYAATDRSELFAEAVVAVWGTPQQDLRQRLRIFQRSIADVGVARVRLPVR